MARDLGVELKIVIEVDATTGKSVATKRGLQGIRHMDTKYLWVQQRVANDEFVVKKIPRSINTGDFMTHHADSRNQVVKLMGMMCYERKSGSSKSELKLANDILSLSAFNLVLELEPKWCKVD